MEFRLLKTVDTWVFDLDNTLYPPAMRIFDQIEERMRYFVSDYLGVDLHQADILRAEYWRIHGTTLAGMMDMHGMPPEAFLHYVHDIDFSVLSESPRLAKLIKSLPGRKIVYTNGTEPYAREVLRARGLEQEFEGVYGIEHANYRPKPEAGAFHQVFAQSKITPTTSAMFEDEPRNLKVPADLGMKTIFISPDTEVPNYIDFHYTDLEACLERLVAESFSDKLNELELGQ
jgi:putative hydrolase of the HAD superfamily